jgi:hypothetical protein
VSGSFFVGDDLAQVVDAISGEGDDAVLADAVDPKATVFRVHVAAEHIEIGSMRIASELLLDLQRRLFMPRGCRGTPNVGRNRDHRRDNALTTAAAVRHPSNQVAGTPRVSVGHLPPQPRLPASSAEIAPKVGNLAS